MDGLESGGSVNRAPGTEDVKQFGNGSKDAALFDASQYAFFGADVVEEVELGGLEDEEEELPPVGFDEEEFLFDKEEGESFRTTSDVDDLAGTLAKLSRGFDGIGHAGFIADRASRENSFTTEWAQSEDLSNWYDRQRLVSETIAEGKRLSSQPFSSINMGEQKNLYRTTSYPEQQQQPQHQHFSSEPILVPKSTYVSYPTSDGRSHQASPNQYGGLQNIPYPLGGPPVASPPLSNSQIQLPGMHQGSPQFGGNMHHQFAPGLAVNNRPAMQWGNRPSVISGDNSGVFNNLLQQQLPKQQFHHQNGLVAPQLIAQMQGPQNRLHQPSYAQMPGLAAQLFNSHLSASPPLNNSYDAMVGLGEGRDGRPRSGQGSRQGSRFLQQGYYEGHRRDFGWPQFRAKYMSTDEIEGILRMQLAATHSSDPYVDDYYHQACLAKKSAGANLKKHFCPTYLRDLPPRARANNEPHAFLQVEALGRVPFSSIRRPRPLLEVDSSSSSFASNVEPKDSDKPLEQEPMLAARVIIEDGLCLLLDVDDIDRFLEVNQLQDGGDQLKRKRQSLLEGLAALLQVVDPFSKNGNKVGLASQDDFIFLRIVTLPKGRKLVARYLQLLLPSSELMRIVCMSIFRHLRFLFGVLPTDLGAAQATDRLARVVALSVQGMHLGPISACLAAVACSSEQPPLRPLGSSSGDGASLTLKSVLDRATEILRASNYSPANMSLWRASFDEFFNLLMKYCINKYDSIVQSLSLQGNDLSDAAQAILKEMPVEILRACFPHINEQQKRLLMEFLKQSMLVSAETRGALKSDLGRG